MQIQVKRFNRLREHSMFRYGSKLYYKIQVAYYIDAQNQAGIYNAVSAKTGELVWVDVNKKVEVIAQ